MLRRMGSKLAKTFIARWAAATASERANSQPYLCELCDVLGVARLEPTREHGKWPNAASAPHEQLSPPMSWHLLPPTVIALAHGSLGTSWWLGA